MDDPSPTPSKQEFSPEFCSFIDACLQKDAEARPTADQVCQLKRIFTSSLLYQKIQQFNARFGYKLGAFLCMSVLKQDLVINSVFFFVFVCFKARFGAFLCICV